MPSYTLSVYRRFNSCVGSLDPRRLRSIPPRAVSRARALKASLGSLFARLDAGRLESTRLPVFALADWRGEHLGFDFLPQPRNGRRPGLAARAATLGSIQPRRAEEPGSW